MATIEVFMGSNRHYTDEFGADALLPRPNPYSSCSCANAASSASIASSGLQPAAFS